MRLRRIYQSAAKALGKIPQADRLRLIEAIDKLKTHPAAGSVLKGEFYGLRRVRVGDFRIIYELRNKELIVLVVRIAHRKEVYR